MSSTRLTREVTYEIVDDAEGLVRLGEDGETLEVAGAIPSLSEISTIVKRYIVETWHVPVHVMAAPPKTVEWLSLTANGRDGEISTTELTATFDIDPMLNTNNFVVTGASKGVVTKEAATYKIAIHSLTGENRDLVYLDVINSFGYTIAPIIRSVEVYKAATLERPQFVAPLIFPQLTAGDSGSFSAAYCFAGDVDEYAIATGTIPAEFSFNTATCVFTYEDVVTTTLAGISLVGENAAGVSNPTNEADWVIVEDASGAGTTMSVAEYEALYGEFKGSPNINLTGIDIYGLTIFDTPDTVPKIIRATPYGNMNLAGSRAYNNFGYELAPEYLAIRPIDLDYRMTLTYADGSPIEDREGLLTAFTREPLNPYENQTGTIMSVVAREPSVDYKLTVSAFGKNGSLIRGFTFEQIIPAISDNALPVTYVDWENGDDANDGGDPLGLALVGATYVDATRTLTLAGGFVDYDHEAATSNNRTQWFNKIKLLTATEGGFTPILVEIESKVSNNAVILKTPLGANFTGITSSTGAKLTLVTSSTNNTRQCMKLGGKYPITTEISMGYAGVREFIGWGEEGLSDAVITKTTAGAITSWFSNKSSNLSGTTWWIFSRITLDGEYQRTLTTASGTAENGVRDAVLLFDRTTLTRSSGGQTFGYNFSGSNHYNHKIKMMFYGGLMDNLPNPSGTNNKTNGMFCVNNEGAWATFHSPTMQSSDYTNDNRHHIAYLSYSLNDIHIANVRTVDDKGLPLPEYAFNLNMLFDSRNISIVDNYFGSGTKRGVDCSITNDNYDVHYGDDVYIVNNDMSTKLTGVYQYSARTIRAAYNRYWNANPLTLPAFFKWDGNPGWMGLDFKPRIYLDNNKVYNATLTDDDTNRAYYEETNNTAFHEGNFHVMRTSTGSIVDMESKFVDNNFYAPNKSGETIIRADNTNITLEAFNTLSGGNNVSVDPNWDDPQNGNFNVGGGAISIPSSPTALTSTGSDSQVSLEWVNSVTSGINAATGQRVYRSINNDFEGASQVGSDLDNELSEYDDVSVTNGTTYYYWITAFNSFGESLPSTVTNAIPDESEVTIFTDNFNRANEPLSNSPNWNNLETTEGIALSINSNSLLSTVNAVRSNRCLAALEDNQWDEIAYAATGTNSIGYVLCRVHATLVSFYGLRFFINATTGSGEARLQKYTSGVASFVGDAVALTSLPATGTIRIDAEGTTIRLYVNDVLVATRTDSSFTGGLSGARIFYGPGSTMRLDNFRCGNL